VKALDKERENKFLPIQWDQWIHSKSNESTWQLKKHISYHVYVLREVKLCSLTWPPHTLKGSKIVLSNMISTYTWKKKSQTRFWTQLYTHVLCCKGKVACQMVHFAVWMEQAKYLVSFLCPVSREFKYPTQSLLIFLLKLLLTLTLLAHNQSCMLWCSRLQTPYSALIDVHCVGGGGGDSKLTTKSQFYSAFWVHKFNTIGCFSLRLFK
jgi:hypothetical protein